MAMRCLRRAIRRRSIFYCTLDMRGHENQTASGAEDTEKEIKTQYAWVKAKTLC